MERFVNDWRHKGARRDFGGTCSQIEVLRSLRREADTKQLGAGDRDGATFVAGAPLLAGWLACWQRVKLYILQLVRRYVVAQVNSSAWLPICAPLNLDRGRGPDGSRRRKSSGSTSKWHGGFWGAFDFVVLLFKAAQKIWSAPVVGSRVSTQRSGSGRAKGGNPICLALARRPARGNPQSGPRISSSSSAVCPNASQLDVLIIFMPRALLPSFRQRAHSDAFGANLGAERLDLADDNINNNNNNNSNSHNISTTGPRRAATRFGLLMALLITFANCSISGWSSSRSKWLLIKMRSSRLHEMAPRRRSGDPNPAPDPEPKCGQTNPIVGPLIGWLAPASA